MLPLRVAPKHATSSALTPRSSGSWFGFFPTDTRTRVKVEVMTSGEYPGDGKPKPVAFPDPVEVREKKEDLWVIGLEKLIELKLASGLTAPHRLKDLADVQELILHLHLPRELAERLDGSVRTEYGRLWDAAEAGRAGDENR